MTNVITLRRCVEIAMVIDPVVRILEDNSLLITYERVPYASETSTYGLNKPGEDFEEYCDRMEYHEALHPPHFPVPAPISRCTHHLNLIAAEPMQAWEDFKALGWHGRL